MSVKTVSYEVNMIGITPASVQQGGVQGDHNATSLSFHIDDVLYSELQMHATEGKKLVYRFDGYDSVGGTSSTVPQVLTAQYVGYGLENWLTHHGGRITVYLVFSVIDENADPATELELYCFPAVLQLKDKPEASDVNGENYESLSSLAVIARESASVAVDSKEIAVDAMEKTEQAKAQLEGGTRWVFDGGGAAGKTYLSLVADGAMSDNSVNPVQNKVVKAAVDSTREEALAAAQTAKEEAVAESDAAFKENFNEIAADYIVEQGYDKTTEMYYRKWNNGTAECWGTLTWSGTITTSTTSGRYMSSRFSKDFPANLFNSTPNIQASPQYGNVSFEIMRWQYSWAGAGKTGDYFIVTESQLSTAPAEVFRISLYAIGTWK